MNKVMKYKNLKEIGIQILQNNKEKILKIVDEAHVIDKRLTDLWDKKELCYNACGKLEIDIDERLLKRQGREWIEVDMTSDPSAGWIVLTFFIDLERHNPMRLVVNWMNFAKTKKIFELDVIHDEDYLHLETEDDVPWIKRKISQRIDKFLSKNLGS